jgi:hypothetical protein
VQCLGKRCTVEGPGEVRDVSFTGILIDAVQNRLNVRDLTIRDNGVVGVASLGSRGRIKLERVTVTGNRSGVETTFDGAVTGSDVDASGNHQWGIVAGKALRLLRTTALDTGVGFPAPAQGVVCLNCAGSLIESTVAGSTEKDVVTMRKPHLVRSTCGTSGKIADPAATTWGVCTDD